MQRGGEEDDEQQGEEEGCTADKLKEVEGAAADAAGDHLLQDEGHEGQELTGEPKSKCFSENKTSEINVTLTQMVLQLAESLP